MVQEEEQGLIVVGVDAKKQRKKAKGEIENNGKKNNKKSTKLC